MNFLKNLINNIFPKLCVFCAREVVEEEDFVCEECAERLVRLQGSLCKTCGCAVHRCNCNVPRTLSTARFVFWHSGFVKSYVGTMKKKKFEELFNYGAGRMYKLICDSDYFLLADRITYVPRSRKAFKNIGVDPAYELARRISDKTGIVLEGYLSSAEKLYEQKELSTKERLKNVKGVFSMAENAPTPFGRIILVDDVMTTGATAGECAKVLKKAGANEVLGLFLSRTHHEELIN